MLSMFGRREIRAGTVEVRRNPGPGDARRPPFPRGYFAALIALAILGLLAFTFGRIVLDGYQLNREAERLRVEIASLQTDNRHLLDQAAELQRDEAVERLARERLGWTRPGETAIVVVPTDSPERSTEAVGPTQPESPPNWQRWLQLFFGP